MRLLAKYKDFIKNMEDQMKSYITSSLKKEIEMAKSLWDICTSFEVDSDIWIHFRGDGLQKGGTNYIGLDSNLEINWSSTQWSHTKDQIPTFRDSLLTAIDTYTITKFHIVFKNYEEESTINSIVDRIKEEYPFTIVNEIGRIHSIDKKPSITVECSRQEIM